MSSVGSVRGDILTQGGGALGAVDQGAGSGDPTDPWIVQPSDGAAVYVGTKTGQLPAALVGGRLDVNIGAAPAGLTIQEPLSVDDNGGSLTVDANNLDIRDLLSASDSVTAVLNEPISVDDNGGSLTVDGPLTDGQLRAAVVPVGDGAGSLTVDAPLGTPVGVRLSDGVGAMATFLPIAEIRAATLHVTGVAAVNTGVTITLPAAGAGLFHYITSIQLNKQYSVIGVAAGAGVVITSTNLPGGPAWNTEQLASAAGTNVRVIDYSPVTPLKSAVANTATTLIAPAQLQTIWRWNVSYFTAA